VILLCTLLPQADASNIVETRPGYHSNLRDADLYLLNPFDFSTKQLTGYKGPQDFDGFPTVFGDLIAYNSFPQHVSADTLDIYIHRLSDPPDQEPLNMTRNKYCDCAPAWSPDGRYFAFHGSQGNGTEEWQGLHVWNWVEDEERAYLLHDTAFRPTWSPDGQQIAYARATPGDMSVWRVERSTLNTVEVVQHADWPDWAPNGQAIVVSGSADHEIYAVDLNGGAPVRLTDGLGEEIDPEYSPDGTRVAFTSYRDGNAEIYVMAADGSGEQRLTNNSGFDGYPTWTENGLIVYSSERGVSPKSTSRVRVADYDDRTFRALATCRE
jgi:Tol biopolymer transport system component